jgi:hypothetical protein
VSLIAAFIFPLSALQYFLLTLGSITTCFPNLSDLLLVECVALHNNPNSWMVSFSPIDLVHSIY